MFMAKKRQLRPKQERGTQTYNKLILCGLKLLTETDLGQIRFAQISKISKVPQSLIDYHFPSMQSFQMAMIQYKMNQLFALTLNTLEKYKANGRKALEAYVKVPFQFAIEDKEFSAVWTAYNHLISVNTDFATFNSTVQKNGHERIMNLIRSLLVDEKSKLNTDFILEDLAHQIHGIIMGYTMMAVTHKERNYLKWQKLALASVHYHIALASEK